MQNPWQPLFASGETPETSNAVRFRVLNRGGQPFLFLPSSNAAAARALDLYPAQSTKARIARILLKVALHAGFALGTKSLTATIPETSAFARFLSKVAGMAGNRVPQFAVLAGNPSAPGRRFVFLLFDKDNKPAAVVKAGHEHEARLLIQREASVLSSARAGSTAIPHLRRTFSSPQVEAFSTDFIPGQSPPPNSTHEPGKIFSSWLNPLGKVRLREIDAWKRFTTAANNEPLLQIISSLGEIEVVSTLMHGDFAPWNVKVEGERWTVLDWERGEIAGVPTWDWLHFIIQPAVLVERENAGKTLARLDALFASPEFSNYAQQAKISGHEHALTLAYLIYCIRVTRQTEGLERISALMKLAEEKWAGDFTVQRPPGTHKES
ncbi:MAG: hypothetical protein HOP33_15425 [Verrucomicrobia bacterium]|nr:hypothetical protein [Verrucomicrobiota bacterium]